MRMHESMRSLALLLPAIMLAGCGEAFFGMCGPSDTLEWTDPDLYAALPANEAPLDEGLANASAFGLPEGRIRALQWSPSESATGERFAARAGLDVNAVAVEARDDETARALLARFLANASGGDEWAKRRMLDAAIAAKEPSLVTVEDGEEVVVMWRYATAPEGDWRVEEIAAEAAPQARSEFASAGSMRIESARWAFVVALPVRSLDFDGITLRVDAAGSAHARMGERPEGATQEDSVARVLAGLRARGLPEPPLAPTVRTMVC